MDTKKSLKIFVDGYLLNKEHQGTKTYIRELYKEFSKQHKDILIYIGCFKDLDLEKEFFEFKNIKFIYFVHKKRMLRMFYEIPKIIKKNQFDFAHFQYVIPFFRTKKCKYIVTIHDILFNDFKEYFSTFYRLKRNFLFKYSAKKANFLLTVSEYSKERIEKYYDLKRKDILITPNGVNKYYFKKYNKQKSINHIKDKYGAINYILYISRIEPRKNQHSLLKAFIDLEISNYQLVFIGSKTLDNLKFNKLIRSLTEQQQKRVKILDNIPDQDLLHFYRAAQAFVYPTLAEGFGIPPLEAGALKIPVLSSNMTAMKEYNFFAPYFINTNDYNLFKNSLLTFLENKDEIDLEKIQQKIRNNYSWAKSSEIFKSIIEK